MIKLVRLALFALFVAVAGLATNGSAHAYTNSRLMDDQIFDNASSMSEGQIQSFLAGKGPCLANYNDVDPNWNGSAWTYGGSVSAAHIIYKVSQQWGLNPQVIIATLQKEESLITGTSCDGWRYNSAMGYGCPDSGGCNAKYAGFTRQVLWGSWQLKFNKERSYGNLAWDGDGDISYVGYMTAGVRKRCNSCSNFSFDGNASIDGQTIYLENGTTASLYTYTPHLGQSFPGIFESWFGQTLFSSYKFVSASNPPSTMLPGQTATVNVILKNTGGKTWWDETNATYDWNKDPAGGGAPTPMRLFTTRPDDHSNPFGGGTGWVGNNRMTMLSGKVNPGDSGVFQFDYTAPTAPGTYLEYFAPTIENALKLPDTGMAFQVTVPSIYDYQYVTATNPPSNMQPGQTATVSVTLKNTGNLTWGNESGQPTTPARLYTSRPIDHTNAFGGGTGWVGSNRMTMQTSSVAPGQNGVFTFQYTAPSTPGTYEDFFALTIENVTKLRDVGMEFLVHVH